MKSLRFDPIRAYLRLLSGNRYVAALTIWGTVAVIVLVYECGFRAGWWR